MASRNFINPTIIFLGDGILRDYYSQNPKDIDDPKITLNAVGNYTIEFLTGQKINKAFVPIAPISVQVPGPAGTGTIANVVNSPSAEFNPEASSFPWKITFKLEVLDVTARLLVLGDVLRYVKRSIITVNIKLEIFV